MRRFFELFSNIGTKKEHSPSEKRVINMVNQASVIAIFFSVIFIIINAYSGSYDVIIPSLIVIFLFSLVPFFNHQKQYSTAKKLFVGFGLFATTVAVAISELETNMYFYFATVFAAMLLFFPDKKYLKKIIMVIFVSMSSSMSISYFGLLPKLSLLNPLALGIINILLFMFVMYILISTLTSANQTFERKSIELLENINERNLELKAEKKKVETTAEVLIETNANLHQEVIEREKVERSLRESNHTLQQFTYVASHDLKEPLRTIGSFANLLVRKLKGNLDEREQEYLHFITDGVSRMSVLVDDLLKYATLNNSRDFEQVDLNNTLEVIKHSLINLLDRKNGDIEFGLMPKLYANRSQLNQLFQNLISNGLKFNTNPSPKIRIKCQEQESEYLFSVSDNGIGIPKDYQEKIWVIFQRLHSRDKFEGSGIGLAIAQKVVANHLGRIWVESEENQGTTFYFTISKKLCSPSKDVSDLVDLVIEETTHN